MYFFFVSLVVENDRKRNQLVVEEICLNHKFSMKHKLVYWKCCRCENLLGKLLTTPVATTSIATTIAATVTATAPISTGISAVSAMATVATFWIEEIIIEMLILKILYLNCQRWNLLHVQWKTAWILNFTVFDQKHPRLPLSRRFDARLSYQYETIKIIKQINDWMKIQLKYFIYHHRRRRHHPKIQPEHQLQEQSSSSTSPYKSQ